MYVESYYKKEVQRVSRERTEGRTLFLRERAL